MSSAHQYWLEAYQMLHGVGKGGDGGGAGDKRQTQSVELHGEKSGGSVGQDVYVQSVGADGEMRGLGVKE